MTVLVRFPGVPPTNHRPRTDHDVSLQTGRHNSSQPNHFSFSVATRTAPAARLACISPLGCVVHRHRPMALRSLVYNRGYHGCALHLRRFRVSGMLTTFFLSYAPRHAATPVLGRSTSGLPFSNRVLHPFRPPPPALPLPAAPCPTAHRALLPATPPPPPPTPPPLFPSCNSQPDARTSLARNSLAYHRWRGSLALSLGSTWGPPSPSRRHGTQSPAGQSSSRMVSVGHLYPRWCRLRSMKC